MGAIANLKVGEQTRIRLYLKACDVRKTNTKPPRDFLNATFTDGEDDLDAKQWNYVNVGNLPAIKQCYDVVGQVGEYNGKKQLTLQSMTVSDDQDLTAFQLSIGVPIQELWDAIQEAIGNIRHDRLRYIVATVYTKYKGVLASSSSAKAVHHVGAGGNLLHTLETYNIASVLCDCFPSQVGINKSLTQAGALLHDIGKAWVYVIEGPAVDYTYEGHIHDHIVAGIRMLMDITWDPKDEELINLLIHIISSHHGKLEFGSPVAPKFIEAHIVNHADGLSATIDTINTANLKAAPDDILTERLFTLGNMPQIKQAHIYRVLLDADTPNEV